MTIDYKAYKPLVLQDASVETLKSDEYREFILSAAIEPGVRLVMQRHRLRPDWPYVDTKFNPNTGRDLGPESYTHIHAWFLGRGGEALDGHLPWMDRLEGLGGDERREARDLFRELVGTMAQAIWKMTERNSGRCPFKVNLDLKAIDDAGNEVDVDPAVAGAGDIFCGKGLIAEGSEANVRRGVEMLLATADNVRAGRYGVQQAKEQPPHMSHGPRMLFQAASGLIARKTEDAELRGKIFCTATEFAEFVLDHYYNAETTVFSEYIDRKTLEPQPEIDPGHCNEFVGLGLAGIHAAEGGNPGVPDEKKGLLARAKREMPRMLVTSTRLGFNTKHPGMFKLVDTSTGRPINPEMPWWNLPETMRAGAMALRVCDDEQTRGQILRQFADCHNAYFQHYLNPDKMLFPFQTLSGETGEVLDVVPAVPEGDPLYHTNLSLLEMLEVIEEL